MLGFLANEYDNRFLKILKDVLELTLCRSYFVNLVLGVFSSIKIVHEIH